MSADAGIPGAADRLNADCFCLGTDLDALHAWLDRDLQALGLRQPVLDTHPHLFSAAPVFVEREQLDAMLAIIAAVEAVVALPAWQRRVLEDAPAIARPQPPVHGLLQGYDFHLTAAGPRLIEINSNAGGALLNLELIRAQRACCDEVADLISGPNTGCSAQDILDMFLQAWRDARGDAPLRRIAIVDTDPEAQYLYPEFLLFQRLFEAHGIAAVIADPATLCFEAGALRDAEGVIDLVYNRLTDFYLEAPEHAALRAAYTAGAVVTPNPHEHALYANKRNLTLLSDADVLDGLGVDAATIATLIDGVPSTRLVRASDADELWAARNALFFKPASGFGSRGSYRGAKVTRKVFAEILEGDYVAQALVPPSLRVQAPDGATPLKFDIRVYVHRGALLLVAARLYQGQTTNFRTPGGGFAPVYHPPAAMDADGARDCSC
ncbi:MAG TPA: hypothetical protein VLA56_02995 [Pseudomonadales bacterium]|nr:hypothetical protein [Pseudomonadales bacterium]